MSYDREEGNYPGDDDYLNLENDFGVWSKEKCAIFREEFLDFLDHVKVNSKELGQIVLGEHIYRAQLIVLDGILDALSKGIHDIKILKSRQLGISTFCRALTLFWNGMHHGLHGYLTLDTGQHKEEARLELLTMIRNLPPHLGFPGIKRENRDLLELANESMMNFASAGVRSSKSSGTLGRSSGISFANNSEMCSWDSNEGIESYKNAFAEDNPNRLYLWESTARGFNLWHEMWTEAKADPDHQYTIFLGWWSKDSQHISRNHPDFEKYGAQAPSVNELKKIRAVKEQYGWDITPEQLAWVRRKMDPTAKKEGDADADFEGSTLKIQEQPWTEEEAFQITGATFFEPVDLTRIASNHTSKRFQTYTFSCGIDFFASAVHKAHNAKSVQFKVWEEPDPDGVYVVAVDPAFGSNENNDRSAIQVLRCYADCVEQVAEYAWPLINTRQLAWVVAAILGWYSECYMILELNGPGGAVLQEFRSLSHQLRVGYQRAEAEERGLSNIFTNVKQYLYGRVDSMSAGRNLHFQTTGREKVYIMERLRDFVSTEKIILRSMDTVEEMKAITREGDSIEAAGSKKDDRVMALALGVRCWEEKVRKGMSAMKRTREFEVAKRRMTVVDQANLFQNNQITAFFASKNNARMKARTQALRDSWRRGVRR